MSHPSWVCGLKPQRNTKLYTVLLSHPSWVCGLKRENDDRFSFVLSHTLRGCVD